MQKSLKSLLLIGFLSASTGLLAQDEYNYQTWKENRLEKLQQPDGWLSLVGLEWLKVGENSIGSAADNDIRLSHGPDHLGTLIMTNDQSMFFVAKPDVGLKADEKLVVDEIPVYADTHDEGPTVFTVDSFLFYAVERGRMGFRIKDSAAETRLKFQGLDYFPEQHQLRVSANFIPYDPVKIIPTVNVLGLLSNEESPGRLEFEINGESFSIDAFDSDDAYYLVFADQTNGKTTYGPGRFLYTDGKVDDQGKVQIDFNKAYNPPCAFTAFSTCTLPPLQNRLAIQVKAGELKYGDSTY